MVLFLTLPLLRAAGQDCDCASQFSFVKTYFESNNPAFQKIKNSPSEYKNYLAQVKLLTGQVSKESSTDRCNIYFEKYIALLKDHHSGIDFKIARLPVNTNSKESIDSFQSTAAYKAFAKIAVDTAALIATLQAKPVEGIEGLYATRSGLFFGITKTTPGHFIGVVLRKTNLLDVGHVLLEFTQKTGNTFDCIYHTGLLALNFQNMYTEVRVADGKIPALGFSKMGLPPAAQREKSYRFQVLDSATNYLKLTSFDRGLKAELDSFYRGIDAAIQSKPYLIIDVRDNGGGSEECYYDLVKYIYTKPLQTDQAEVWVSPDNIQRYQEASYSPQLIERMKNAKQGVFIPQTRDSMSYWTMEGTGNPKRVALLFNRQTASSAEGLILYCLQSSKVITIGENSGGFIGYGDVMAAPLPCGKFSLRSTTTKYENKSKYEFVGIKPMYQLSAKQDGVVTAKSLLHKK